MAGDKPEISYRQPERMAPTTGSVQIVAGMRRFLFFGRIREERRVNKAMS
ncbi:hypothetical protein GRAN_0865 [Granulicella sibirica]|uniref:Uncharacterized protein n=1 Tax=Granulicella sibirica TaxID=2479048 RepID=A0A4Q0T1N3_9BACT|nr:hypothetical protein GRAN_0865 [Granulicella sibirica]